MLFRPIRGSFKDSMRDSVEITTMSELSELVDGVWNEHPLQISWDGPSYDNRINTNVWTIMCKMPQFEHPQAEGYLHGNPEELIK